MSRIVAGPFNRVEGDLEITLETGEDKVPVSYTHLTLPTNREV